MDTIRVNSRTVIPLCEVSFTYDRSPGPGGQNVNKVNTRAELRFSPASSQALRPDQRARLQVALASRLTADGALIIRSSRYRSQRRNRDDCLEKLAALLAQHLRPPPPKRRPTRPSGAGRARRLDAKKRQSQKKTSRQRPHDD